MTRWMFCLAFVGCLTARAQADTPLQVARAGERLRVDGSLREWRGARFVSLGRGEGSLRYSLASRDGGLYLAAEVQDASVVRRTGVGPGQDALVLSLAMPNRAGGLVSTELWLHPGIVGQRKAAAATGPAGSRKPKPARGVQVVEGPREGVAGYVLEAFIPWAAVREADLWQMGRGALRYENAARPGKAVVSAQTAPLRPRQLQVLPALAMGEGEVDLVRAFAREKGLSDGALRFDIKGDVQGDSRAERVSLLGGYVVVSGPGVHAGESYAYMDLGVGVGGGLSDAKLSDLTGDGKAELLVAVRTQSGPERRRVWTVIDLSQGNPRRVFGVELEKQVAGGSLHASLVLGPARRGKPRRIVVRRAEARGVEASQYREPTPGDVQPILSPWGPVSQRVYAFQAGRFSLVDETRDAEPPMPAEASRSASSKQAPVASPPPPPPSLEALVRAAKAEAGIGASVRPDHHLAANVSGGGNNEHVYVFGARLIVVGPDMGPRYFSYGLPVSDPRDLHSVQTADLTGDGRHELLLRVRQDLGGEGVQRELLLVQRFTKQGFDRALSVEVSRWQGARRIDNRVATGGGVLRIAAGKARGWTSADYPFPDEAVGGAGRLLLPWRNESVRYRLVGGSLVP